MSEFQKWCEVDLIWVKLSSLLTRNQADQVVISWSLKELESYNASLPQQNLKGLKASMTPGTGSFLPLWTSHIFIHTKAVSDAICAIDILMECNTVEWAFLICIREKLMETLLVWLINYELILFSSQQTSRAIFFQGRKMESNKNYYVINLRDIHTLASRKAERKIVYWTLNEIYWGLAVFPLIGALGAKAGVRGASIFPPKCTNLLKVPLPLWCILGGK